MLARSHQMEMIPLGVAVINGASACKKTHSFVVPTRYAQGAFI